MLETLAYQMFFGQNNGFLLSHTSEILRIRTCTHIYGYHRLEILRTEGYSHPLKFSTTLTVLTASERQQPLANQTDPPRHGRVLRLLHTLQVSW